MLGAWDFTQSCTGFKIFHKNRKCSLHDNSSKTLHLVSTCWDVLGSTVEALSSMDMGVGEAPNTVVESCIADKSPTVLPARRYSVSGLRQTFLSGTISCSKNITCWIENIFADQETSSFVTSKHDKHQFFLTLEKWHWRTSNVKL